LLRRCTHALRSSPFSACHNSISAFSLAGLNGTGKRARRRVTRRLQGIVRSHYRAQAQRSLANSAPNSAP